MAKRMMKHERRRQAVANMLEKEILKKTSEYYVHPSLRGAVGEWYMALDEDDKILAQDLVIHLIDMMTLRANDQCGREHINFGPLSALEILGAAIAVDRGWLRCPVGGG